MAKVDFYNLIKGNSNKTKDLHVNLLTLFDNLLKKSNIKDEETRNKLARLRAKIDIELRDIL